MLNNFTQCSVMHIIPVNMVKGENVRLVYHDQIPNRDLIVIDYNLGSLVIKQLTVEDACGTR